VALAAPELSSWAMLAVGLLSLSLIGSRARKRETRRSRIFDA
jgi:hypothetical protein